MGLLDTVIGALGQGGGQPDLLKLVVGMLGNDAPGGGLAGLAAKFQQGGMGDVMNSWISTGQNMPVSGNQLEAVLGGDTIEMLSRQLGSSQGDVLGQLTSLLPKVVDQLTPNGNMPQGGVGSAADLLGMFARR